MTPTCGRFCNFSCNDLTGKESFLCPGGELGGDIAIFLGCVPSRFKGGTMSILPSLCDPVSGLNRRGLEGKLPVIRGEANGVGSAVADSILKIPDIPCIEFTLIPLCAQKDSSVRAWCTTLPESGLCSASTSNTLRLHPRDGMFSSDLQEEAEVIYPTRHPYIGVYNSETK